MPFHIKADKKEARYKTIRFPKRINDKIKKEAVKNSISFSKVVIQACEYALNNLKEDDP